MFGCFLAGIPLMQSTINQTICITVKRLRRAFPCISRDRRSVHPWHRASMIDCMLGHFSCMKTANRFSISVTISVPKFGIFYCYCYQIHSTYIIPWFDISFGKTPGIGNYLCLIVQEVLLSK